MDNGFSTADAVLTSAMSGGFGNRGGGLWGNAGCGAPFADPASNAVRINRNADVAEANDRCTKQVLGAGLDRISDQAEEGRRTAQFTSIRDGQFQAELRSGDRLRDIEKSLSDMRLDNCKCCEEAKLLATQNACDTQRLIIEKSAATDALILAVEARANLDKLAECRSELSSLKTQVACGCNCPSRS